MSQADKFYRFIFEEHDIRGELVCLSNSYQDAIRSRAYPEQVRALLGECLAASVLLSGTLKFDGILSIQAKGNGPVSLMMAECTHYRTVRAVAQWSEDAQPGSGELPDLVSQIGEGHMAITIDPEKGQRYQGIVPLVEGGLGSCLESYFQHSEQLETKLFLFSDQQYAAGLLLQKLPAQKAADPDAWNRICHLGSSLTFDELKTLSGEQIVHRLYHEEDVRLYPEENIRFECSCSQQRTEMALKSLGEREVYGILEEDNLIEIDCHFCAAKYRFEREQVDRIFQPPTLQ